MGAVVVTRDVPPPEGLADSKALSAKQREALVRPLKKWSMDWALGSVSAVEIDRWGLRLALAVAATRAIDGLKVRPTHALLDGSFNLLDAPLRLGDEELGVPRLTYASLHHTTVIRGDARCGTIAAASVIAKVHRDRVMRGLAKEFPTYGWHSNKGYGAPVHLRALVESGPCDYHRKSWRLTY